LIGNIESFQHRSVFFSGRKGFDVTGVAVAPEGNCTYIDDQLAKAPPHTFGLYDGRSKRLLSVTSEPEVLKALEPNLSEASRAGFWMCHSCQRYLLDEIIQPQLRGATKELTKTIHRRVGAGVPMTDGAKSQIALLLKSTPVERAGSSWGITMR